MRNLYICTMCSKKYTKSENPPVLLTENNFGLCSKCMKKLAHTDTDGCFAGTKHMSYVISPFYYRNEVRKSIQAYKFHNNYIFAQIFSHLIIKKLELNNEIQNFDILVPIPLSDKRMLERGYNQSALISKRIAEHFNIAYSEDILTRNRNTQKQSVLSGMARILNIRNSFTCESNLSGMKILLFDDVFTTGSTMNEAAKTLINAGAEKVVGITAAIVK